MLNGGFEEVIRNNAQLNQLDSIGGDGDHGVTMLRAAEALCAQLREPAKDISTLLSRAGDTLLSNDGGASGGLLGSFFLGAAAGCQGKKELNCPALSAVFASGLSAFKRYTKAQVGDKTMLDALAPAVEAIEEAALRKESPEAALEMAASSALQGAANTKSMQARLGRAKHVGVRSIGWQDPGATTIALLFRGFANATKELTRSYDG